jgi:hydroxymethylpyrimidine pyrophosphatase-like HAD family hydrolase
MLAVVPMLAAACSQVAKSIVASNDDHGVAEALERFVLSRAASTFC